MFLTSILRTYSYLVFVKSSFSISNVRVHLQIYSKTGIYSVYVVFNSGILRVNAEFVNLCLVIDFFKHHVTFSFWIAHESYLSSNKYCTAGLSRPWAPGPNLGPWPTFLGPFRFKIYALNLGLWALSQLMTTIGNKKFESVQLYRDSVLMYSM